MDSSLTKWKWNWYGKQADDELPSHFECEQLEKNGLVRLQCDSDRCIEDIFERRALDMREGKVAEDEIEGPAGSELVRVVITENVSSVGSQISVPFVQVKQYRGVL